MQPHNYQELQKASIDIQREVYGWAFEFGPLLVRPDAHDPTKRRVINYYWRRRFLLTSARRYAIINLSGHRILIGLWHGRLVIKDVFHAAV